MTRTWTEWKKIDVPDEIVKHLLERNQKHFGQANGTPLTCPPLSDILDWSASTETADLILEGDYDDDELDEKTALMLRHMKRSTTLDSLSLQGSLIDLPRIFPHMSPDARIKVPPGL